MEISASMAAGDGSGVELASAHDVGAARPTNRAVDVELTPKADERVAVGRGARVRMFASG